MKIRSLKTGDYDEVLKIWREGGITVKKADSKEGFIVMLQRNPDTCFGATEDGELCGVILGGFDGRRGIIHHLAVKKQCRNRGIARELVQMLEKKFREKGVEKIKFWVEKPNVSVVDFYAKIGYHLRDDIVTLSKVLSKTGDASG
ncbi:MAG: GNAT family N-acetyltransferase [Candidatus Zixiibacteriota bacterium]